MTSQIPTTGLQLRSLVTSGKDLKLSLEEVAVEPPGAGEILVRVEATPINPSDLGLLIGPADLATATTGGTADRPTLTATIPERVLAAMGGRLDQSLAVGNEGAGTVIAAGEGASDLIGVKVAMIGGAMYAQYRTVKAADCIVLPSGATAADGASCFVNPLTALGMVETMRREGHTALVHTAAASNLGQMLNRICLADGVPLVNIVRSPEQAAILRGVGAAHVCDSGAATFRDDLTDALVATGATLAFDAIGGGKRAGQILGAMEVAANRTAKEYSRYGSTVHKQVYIYGGLNTAPTELNRTFGMAWGVGGWLLFPFLQKAGPKVALALRERVARELTTTFASHYTARIGLAEALRPAVIAIYSRRATGEKYLIEPWKGV